MSMKTEVEIVAKFARLKALHYKHAVLAKICREKGNEVEAVCQDKLVTQYYAATRLLGWVLDQD